MTVQHQAVEEREQPGRLSIIVDRLGIGAVLAVCALTVLVRLANVVRSRGYGTRHAP